MSEPVDGREELDRLIGRARAELRDWADSAEHDPGLALVELLAYVGDMISEYQDRIANEAYLGTAGRRHAGMRVDVDADWSEASGIKVCGIYRAIVADNVDPLMKRRLRVLIPEVMGDDSLWAAACVPPGAPDEVPAVGDQIWVAFESCDPVQPVWLGRRIA